MIILSSIEVGASLKRLYTKQIKKYKRILDGTSDTVLMDQTINVCRFHHVSSHDELKKKDGYGVGWARVYLVSYTCRENWYRQVLSRVGVDVAGPGYYVGG